MLVSQESTARLSRRRSTSSSEECGWLLLAKSSGRNERQCAAQKVQCDSGMPRRKALVLTGLGDRR